jgi:hypothetical protein
MKQQFLSVALIAGSLLVLTSCNKDDNEPTIVPYTVPETYNFDNVEYQEATARVKMLDGLNKYVSTTQSNMNKVVLDQSKANALWTNSGNPFDTTWLNSTGVNIAEKTADAAIYKGYVDALVTLSVQELTPAANSAAGYIARNAGKIMVNDKGLEYVQAIQKGTMGAMLFNEAISILETVPTSDNVASIEGKGTAMAHNFDLAFGYFSVPVNYDTTAAFATANRPSLQFWGNYIRERGLYINAHYHLWKAFRTGRAAIQAKDYNVVKQQVDIIKEYWEKVAAASAWAYITAPQSQSGNLASQFHGLSEGYGFIAALKYRPANSKLTAPNYQKLVEILGPTANLYDLVADPAFTKLKEAKEILKSAYGQLQAD